MSAAIAAALWILPSAGFLRYRGYEGGGREPLLCYELGRIFRVSEVFLTEAVRGKTGEASSKRRTSFVLGDVTTGASLRAVASAHGVVAGDVVGECAIEKTEASVGNRATLHEEYATDRRWRVR